MQHCRHQHGRETGCQHRQEEREAARQLSGQDDAVSGDRTTAANRAASPTIAYSVGCAAELGNQRQRIIPKRRPLCKPKTQDGANSPPRCASRIRRSPQGETQRKAIPSTLKSAIELFSEALPRTSPCFAGLEPRPTREVCTRSDHNGRDACTKLMGAMRVLNSARFGVRVAL